MSTEHKFKQFHQKTFLQENLKLGTMFPPHSNLLALVLLKVKVSFSLTSSPVETSTPTKKLLKNLGT